MDSIITEQDVLDFYFKNGILNKDHLNVMEFYSFDSYNHIVNVDSLKPLQYDTEHMVGECKVVLLYSILNDIQKNIFIQWFEKLKIQNVMLAGLDAAAGTGKSFLIKIFLMSCKTPFTYCSYRHDLVNNIKFLGVHKFFTTSKFMCSLLSIDLYNTTTKSITKNSIWTFLYLISKVIKSSCKTKNVIIDEYTILSPFHIAILLLLRRHKKIGLIFVGDSHQQHTLSKTKIFNLSNKKIIGIDFDELSLNMRTSDKIFSEKLSKIKSCVTDVEGPSHMFNFHVYREFKHHFLMNPDYSPNVVYLAYKHRQLKTRLNKMKGNVNFKHIPYYARLSNGTYIPIKDRQTNRFPTSIPIKPGFYYLYTELDGSEVIRKIVKLVSTSPKEYVFIDGDNKTIKLNSFVILGTQHLNFNHLNELKKSALEFQSNKSITILGFPIQPLCVKTFHSVQGLTFSSDFKIEVDMNDASTNSIYVGLSRCVSEDNLGKIYSKYINCYEYSLQKNDGYLYIFNTKNKPNVEFKEATTPTLFHKTKISDKEEKSESIDHISNILKFFSTIQWNLINLNSMFVEDIIISVEKRIPINVNNDSYLIYLRVLDWYINNSSVKLYDHELLKSEYELAIKNTH